MDGGDEMDGGYFLGNDSKETPNSIIPTLNSEEPINLLVLSRTPCSVESSPVCRLTLKEPR